MKVCDVCGKSSADLAGDDYPIHGASICVALDVVINPYPGIHPDVQRTAWSPAVECDLCSDCIGIISEAVNELLRERFNLVATA